MMASFEENGKNAFYLREFNNAKSSFLKYYSDIQISLGARLIGFSVAIFTLIQVVNWNKTGLAQVFHLSFTSGIVAFDLKFIPFLVAMTLIMVYIARTIFRYAATSGLCNSLIILYPSEIDDKISVHHAIAKKAYQNMKKRNEKIFVWLPFHWFIAGPDIENKEANDVKSNDDKKEMVAEKTSYSNFYGWIISWLFAILFSFMLLWILW
jgi:hypothetical protein